MDAVITLTFTGKAPATYRCEPPRSQCDMDEVLSLATIEGSGLRARAAAIGLAVPRLVRQLGVAAYSNPVKFGGALYDAMRRAGVSREQIIEGGDVATRWLMTQVITEAEVKEAEGFTEPPPESDG
jgi:hypothetical protein